MSGLVILAPWLVGGVLIGLIYFRMVRQSADLMLSGRRGGPLFGVALVLLRMAGLGGVLIVAAIQGAGPLLAAALGLLIGRLAVMRRAV
ncbi:ATP synthase subunit I [Roseibium aquae]|uniref:N-ATPase subunit AtpR n=1 Tax=Roseibium aquae TaxID=1323746 RepID=UPI00123DFFC1|nr:ATP synthase subunit I [Roseibium aquae]